MYNSKNMCYIGSLGISPQITYGYDYNDTYSSQWWWDKSILVYIYMQIRVYLNVIFFIFYLYREWEPTTLQCQS